MQKLSSIDAVGGRQPVTARLASFRIHDIRSLSHNSLAFRPSNKIRTRSLVCGVSRKLMARPGRFEPSTLCLEGRRSFQLSYGRIPVLLASCGMKLDARVSLYLGFTVSPMSGIYYHKAKGSNRLSTVLRVATGRFGRIGFRTHDPLAENPNAFSLKDGPSDRHLQTMIFWFFEDSAYCLK
jgi:hypothetical protein